MIRGKLIVCVIDLNYRKTSYSAMCFWNKENLMILRCHVLVHVQMHCKMEGLGIAHVQFKALGSTQYEGNWVCFFIITAA